MTFLYTPVTWILSIVIGLAYLISLGTICIGWLIHPDIQTPAVITGFVTAGTASIGTLVTVYFGQHVTFSAQKGNGS